MSVQSLVVQLTILPSLNLGSNLHSTILNFFISPDDISAKPYSLLARKATYHSTSPSKVFKQHEQEDKWMKR